jgi:hypothetical protein
MNEKKRLRKQRQSAIEPWMKETEQKDMRKLGYDICASLTPRELVGLFLTILGDNNCRELNIWDKIKPLFLDIEGELPVMHQDSFVGMSDVAKERNRLLTGDENEN